jgi:hypothetical protein
LVKLLLLTGFLHDGQTCLTLSHCNQHVEQQIWPHSLAAQGESGTSLQITQRNDLVLELWDDLFDELPDNEASIIFWDRPLG